MHTYSGSSKISKIWMDKKKWYWPQPLNSMKEYIFEGKDKNFNAITVLK